MFSGSGSVNEMLLLLPSLLQVESVAGSGRALLGP